MDLWSYVLFFLEMVFYTIGSVVICGLVVGLGERLFLFLMGPGMGRKVVIGTSLIGTPIHELSHALMCLIFRHKIQEIKLWQPCSEDGTLGYVTHAYNPKNPYQVLGNLFIGVGPIFGGLGVIMLCLNFAFPNTLASFFASTAESLGDGGIGIWGVFLAGVQIIPHLIAEFFNDDMYLWVRIVGFVVMMSVSLHINLSLADIKGAATAIPLYLVLVLIPTVVVSLIGYGAMSATLLAVQSFSTLMFAMFTIVFVFALFQILLALIVYILRRALGRK